MWLQGRPNKISIVHSFNTHETVIAEENDNDESGDKVKVTRIGRATNPTLALINHSCDPNYRDDQYESIGDCVMVHKAF